jgi:hypothetical protein
MSVYADAASGYRDTTKWLTAFFPVSGFVAAGLILGRPILEAAQQSPDLDSFLSDNLATVVAVAIGLVGLLCVVASAGWVLSVDPMDIGTLYADKKAGPELVKALGSGALAPYFLDEPSFNDAVTALSAAEAGNNDVEAKSLLERLEPASEILRQWAVFRVMRRRFRWFVGWFILGAVLAVVSFAIAASSLPSGAAIDAPVNVTVEVDQKAQGDLEKTTGCTNPAMTRFVAVGGSWDEPELAVTGPGCTTASRWTPDLTAVLVSPTK